MIIKWLYKVSCPAADRCNGRSVDSCIYSYILPYLDLQQGQYVKPVKVDKRRTYDDPIWEFWVCEQVG